MKVAKESTIEIIDFLKEYHHDFDKELIEVIDCSDNGVYFVNEQSISFSEQAKRLLCVNQCISLDNFYQQINLQDRKKMIQVLENKRKDNKTYEVIYRFKVKNKLIWVKEYGIFSFRNKNMRLALIRNITKQVELDKKLHLLAYYDSTTHLKNRNYYEKDIQFLISYQVPFSLFLMDLNSFKIINDNFGHLFGDYILKEFSQRIKNELERLYDFDFYRLSGDEFALIFPYLTTIKETDKVINLIFECLEPPFNHDNYQIIITPSIGIAFYPKDSKNKTTLLKRADISMYRAKNDNFLNYSYFDKNYYKILLDEKKIENYLEKIIKEDLVPLRFQPIYDITKNEIVSLEALIYTEKFPLDKIFETALKSKLIILLERKIIEKVIYYINKYQDRIPSSIRFTINLTPKTIEYIDVYAEIKSLLIKYDISGNQIGIEITEQYFIKNESKINKLIENLQALGIEIYLDDFGMGFSSVRNLTYLSYDHIKLDKRFISSAFNNQKCQLFIKSILQFSKDIGCDVIVEGVETKEQLDYLQQLGAMYIQGFYLSKPIDIKDFLSLINRSEEDIIQLS
ncbi:EAL domain-containing protein [Mycoplasmatota bacterium]|nr:EAL domain-containing protein [Mycoplasmatota bacterium]